MRAKHRCLDMTPLNNMLSYSGDKIQRENPKLALWEYLAQCGPADGPVQSPNGHPLNAHREGH